MKIILQFTKAHEGISFSSAKMSSPYIGSLTCRIGYTVGKPHGSLETTTTTTNTRENESKKTLLPRVHTEFSV